MIGHRAIWQKSWLESRLRFFIAAALMLLVVGWDILDAERGMRRFDRIPPITFTQYIAYLFGGRLQLIWMVSAFLLGLGGLVRETVLGTAQFTLSLPFLRREWVLVRVTLGLIQSLTVALIPVLVIPLASSLIGQSYSVWEALKFSGLLFAAGSFFLFVGIFWSSLFAGEFYALLAGSVSILLVFTAQDYLYRWIPAFNFPQFNMHGFLAGVEHVDRTTGLLRGWPWRGILNSAAVSTALCYAAVQVVKRRDF
jgi:ABC-type transport system involved in multi-copper enzyme maturation permease subunit